LLLMILDQYIFLGDGLMIGLFGDFLLDMSVDFFSALESLCTC